MSNPDVISGMENLDDAGVYKLSESVALIQTVDFFTPIVDDAYMFGQIAVANALSDVYAMGGRPLTAMNILCFPMKALGASVLEDILRGGMDKIHEAEVVLIGGHSVDDDELKYGLSVTGTVAPDKLLTNSGARVGDKLILTKPLGTGIINTAIKAGVVSDDLIERVSKSMAMLNRTASELMQEAGANACTDITGFGLLGHAAQLAEQSQVSLRLDSASVPCFPEVIDYAQQGLCPGGLTRNKEYYQDRIQFAGSIPEHMQDILFDAQTSGGLLICLAPDKAELLLARLRGAGIAEAAIIGEVIEMGQQQIAVE
jgi:selenide,water dikinase